MIVSGKITKIETENSKMVFIEIRLDKVLAICCDGENLVGPIKNMGAMNANMLKYFHEFYTNLRQYKIAGYIKKHEVIQLILLNRFNTDL